MAYRAIFYRGEILKHDPPTLSYNRKALDHYDVQRYGSTLVYYFARGTRLPKTQKAWQDACTREGLTLVRWNNNMPDGSIEVVARKAGS